VSRVGGVSPIVPKLACQGGITFPKTKKTNQAVTSFKKTHKKQLINYHHPPPLSIVLVEGRSLVGGFNPFETY